MNNEAASKQLGRLVGKARATASRAGLDRIRSARVYETRHRSVVAQTYDDVVIDVDLADALARAEAAEAEVRRLQAELAHKDEILTQARLALRTARLAVREHLRITAQ